MVIRARSECLIMIKGDLIIADEKLKYLKSGKPFFIRNKLYENYEFNLELLELALSNIEMYEAHELKEKKYPEIINLMKELGYNFREDEYGFIFTKPQIEICYDFNDDDYSIHGGFSFESITDDLYNTEVYENALKIVTMKDVLANDMKVLLDKGYEISSDLKEIIGV